jgi:hypothetical protein
MVLGESMGQGLWGGQRPGGGAEALWARKTEGDANI